MRVGIVGSRRRNSMKDRYQVFGLVEELKLLHNDLVLVSGGCRKGADAFAEEAAKAYGVPMALYPVDTSEGIQGRWDYAQKAFSRNRDIAADSDVIYAWVSEDRTGGTENTIGHALDLEKKVFLVLQNGSVYLIKDGLVSCEPAKQL